MLVAGGLIVGANLFRVGRLPLGYVPVLAHWSLFGLLLGTGSFEAAGAPVRPSPWALLGTVGFVEISAYTFLAAATTGLFLFRQRSWTDWTTTRERPLRSLRLSACELVTVGVAVVMVLAGAYRETIGILLG